MKFNVTGLLGPFLIDYNFCHLKIVHKVMDILVNVCTSLKRSPQNPRICVVFEKYK